MLANSSLHSQVRGRDRNRLQRTARTLVSRRPSRSRFRSRTGSETHTILAGKVRFSCRCGVWKAWPKSRFCLIRHGSAERSCDTPPPGSRNSPRDMWRCHGDGKTVSLLLFSSNIYVILMPKFRIFLIPNWSYFNSRAFIWENGSAAVFFLTPTKFLTLKKMAARFHSFVITL